MADNRHYKAKRGEKKYLVATIKDDLGRPVPLTGYTIDFVVTPKDTQTLLFGGSLTPLPDQVAYVGKAAYLLQPSETIDETPGRYDLEMRVKSPSDEEIKLYPLVDGTSFGTFEIVESKIALY